MWEKFWDDVVESPLFLIVAGLLLLLLGASGGVALTSFRINIPDDRWRVVLAIVGLPLISIGIWLQIKEEKEGVASLQTPVIVKWDDKLLVQRLSTAVDVRMLSVSNYSLLSNCFEECKAFLQRGGQLRCIYTASDGQAIRMVALRNIGVEKKVAHLEKQYALTIEAVKDLSQYGSVQVKKIDYPHGIVLTLVDPLLPEGVAFVTINGFGKYYTERPCLVLTKKDNEEAFQFFFETFENIWHSSMSETIPLR